MAVYTVQTSTICRQQYLTNHNSSDPTILNGVSIPQILANVWEDVLPESIPVWEGGSQQAIKTAILRHYWTREIGAETVGLWQFWLQTGLQEIMPWYIDLHDRVTEMANIYLNQTGDSTDTFNHGHTIQKSGTDERNTQSSNKDTGTRDVTGTDTGTIKMDGTDTGTVNRSGTDTGNVETNGTNDTHTERLMSDTPQNGLDDVIQGKYLTKAEVDSNTNSIDNIETRNLQTSSDETRDLKNDNLETRNLQNVSNEIRNLLLEHAGKDTVTYGMKDSHGGTDIHKIVRNGFSGDKVDVLKRYDELHLNIMQMIIRDCGKYWLSILG